MFSFHFRRVRVRVHVRVCRRRRNDFCFSRQNHFSYILDIWDKESIGLGNVLDDLWVTLTQDHGCDIEKLFFWQIFLKNFRCFFSRSNTLLDISQEWLVRLMWNEKEVHWLDTWWTMWPWPLTSPMTLTFDFSRSSFKIAVSKELLSDWCETKRKKVS